MRDEDFLALKKAKKAAKLAASGGEAGPKKKKDRERKREREEAPADAAPKAPVDESGWGVPAPKAAPQASSSDFADKTLACLDCGSDFVFSAGEQAFFHDKGYANGKSRCSECTAAKKARFGEASGPGTAKREREARTTCFTCGAVGHSAKQCKEAACFNCGERGHRSKDCKEPRKNQAGGGVCFKFQSGSCTRGETCRFAHIIESS